jgi:hypothetical protein
MPRIIPKNKPSDSKSSQSGFVEHRYQSPLAPPIPHSPNLPQTVQVQPPGFFSSVLQGFGLGAGSSIAHNMFDSNKTVIHEHKEPPKYTGPCAKEKEVFDKCIEYRKAIEECERILKDLHACYDERGVNTK